ncbi:MAG: hypothetical protein SWH68_11620 [Thermodesulfobacteriota bacterium]|nr:hypothetical protein [Thermodesulfobacteriota bacterium]
MENNFQPGLRAALIGSLPMRDHAAATQMVMDYVPEIPLWVQLPAFEQEGMLAQFLPGFPGLTQKDDKLFIDTNSESFEADVVAFYEDYLSAAEDGKSLMGSRFALGKEEAAGFEEFMHQASGRTDTMAAAKGQITGPFTFATGMVDADDRALFYDDQLRDIAVKLIAMKARWQARRLAELGKPVIIFFDEPGLTAFGSSAFISISKEDVAVCFDEVVEAVHAEGGLTGVHVCANAEWSIILESAADIVSFDAYSFFDKFILYPEQIKKFMDLGNILAWGIVPTSNAADIKKETVDNLAAMWEDQARQIEALGIDRATIEAQSLITPSCGTGSLDLDIATRVLELTRGVSDKLRKNG